MSTTVKYPRAKPYFSTLDKQSILIDIANVLDTGMLTAGRHVAEFETLFADRIGVKHAIATSSCTSALEIAIRALGLKNKKIMVTTNTWMSCANVILLTDNIPVIVDIDPNTLCMSSSTVTSLLDEIDAIIWVHLGGLISPEFVSIAKICKELQIPIIEDCAHAHGAQTEAGEIAGSIGDVGCFSFYPTKLMATGEGGMLTTANDDIATAARIYRNHGTVRNDESDGLDHGVTCMYPSQNFRMTEIAAILGKYQIKQLTDFIKVRNSIADRYRHRLKSIAGINLLPKYFGHVYWNFYIILDPGISRTRFATMLLDTYGIQTANAYDPPIHEQSLYKQFVQTDKFPIASDILKRHVSLPMYVTLSLDDVDDIADAIQHVLDRIKQES